MKRTCYGFVVALFFFLSACAPLGQEKNPEHNTVSAIYYDSPNALYCQGNDRCIAVSSEGYYIMAAHYLYFVDRKNMAPIAVCNKPNCLHSQESDRKKREACAAYFPYYAYTSNAVFCCNGRVYVLAGQLSFEQELSKKAVLYEVFPTESKRKKLIEFPFDSRAISSDLVVIHREKLYIGTVTYSEEGTINQTIFEYPLNKNPSGEIIYNNIVSEYQQLSELVAEDNYLYFAILDSSDSLLSNSTWIKMDISSRICTEAFPRPDGINFSPFPSLFHGKHYSINGRFDDWDGAWCFPGGIYCWENDSERCTLSNMGINETIDVYSRLMADDKYLYIADSGWVPNVDPHSLFLRIIDESGTVIDRMSLYDMHGFSAFMVSPTDHVFLYSYAYDDEHGLTQILWYISKDEIGTSRMHPKVLLECYPSDK